MEQQTENYWGYHAIIDLAGCNLNAITDRDNIYNFAKQLVKDIDMVAYGEPQIVKFGSGDKTGYTLIQLIETSNICAHFVDEYCEVYLDVFSCKPFDPLVVESLASLYFGAKTVRQAFIKRKASEKIEE
jgi:S-adenosylmethionine/arginine decarboxylase-like enzyme